MERRCASLGVLPGAMAPDDRAQAAFMRWAPVLTAVILSALTIPAAIGWDLPMAIALFLVALCSIAYVVFDPAARPKNVARSLEASRQVTAVA
jgi:hypothetical protein